MNNPPLEGSLGGSRFREPGSSMLPGSALFLIRVKRKSPRFLWPKGGDRYLSSSLVQSPVALTPLAVGPDSSLYLLTDRARQTGVRVLLRSPVLRGF